MTDRVTVPGRTWILRQVPSIQKDLPESTAFEKYRDDVGRLHNSIERVIGAACAEDLMRAFWQTTRVRIVLREVPDPRQIEDLRIWPEYRFVLHVLN